MKRRGFVGLVGLGLTAGCSTQLPLSREPTAPEPNSVRIPNPDPEPVVDVGVANATAPDVPVENPVDAPESDEPPVPVEEEQTPVEPTVPADEDVERPLTWREQYGLERLQGADRKFTAVVSAFTNGSGTELTDVLASSSAFLRSESNVTVALAKAQDGYLGAAKSAANAQQELQAQQLVRCWQFLWHATATQVAIVTAHEELRGVYSAFERNYSEGTLSSLALVKAQSGAARRGLRNIRAVSSVDDVAAVSAISTEEYEGKLTQFEADLDIYRELDEILETFSDGVLWLRRAKGNFHGDNRHVGDAKDAAEDAKRNLRTAQRELNALRKNASADVSFVPTLVRFSDLAGQKLDEAEEILDS